MNSHRPVALKEAEILRASKQRTEKITEEAERIVRGDRNVAYGEPSNDLRDIGTAWSATLQAHTQTPVAPIPAHIVALMMAQLKIIRYAHKPHRDGLVDLVGYALCCEDSAPQEEDV